MNERKKWRIARVAINIVAVLIAVFGVAISSRGQSPDDNIPANPGGRSAYNAKLLDEFGKVHCDEFKARVDSFYLNINADPGSQGFFVIRGSKDLLADKLGYELLFESAVLTRSFDRSRVTIVRGKESGPIGGEFWIVHGHPTAPELLVVPWDLRLANDSSPLLLRSDMQQICDPPPVGKLARELLAANPNGKIYVIVHGSNRRARYHELVTAKNQLRRFDASRIRYLLRRSDTAFSDYYFAIGDPSRAAFLD